MLNNNNNSFINVSEYDTNKIFTFENVDYVCRIFKFKKNIDYV